MPRHDRGAKARLRAIRSGEVAVLDDYLSGSQCDRILEELEFAYWTPSEITWRARSGLIKTRLSPGRRSEGTTEEWFSSELRRELRRVETRICTGLDLERSHLEYWQATRYRRGGYFDAHLDTGVFREEPAGDRVVTLLFYLNTPARGGSTYFPELGLDVEARAGRLAAWVNILPDGTLDARMKHAARPVVKGSKITLTSWSRQRPVRSIASEGK
jgi:prolyl 4-hydroxylase